jgi:F420-dependent oxidoreductase-like protein
MKLGAMLGYWGAKPPADPIGTAKMAESLGYDSLWTAEAWGSDAFTPLAWMGAHTSTIKLGTGIVQMSARTPTATAMAALSLDHLSGGRHILGIGASGPQVVEGWYGQPYAKPLARTREYVSILRQVFARDAAVENPGPHYPLPYPGGTGLGKALKPITHPLRADLPIFLAAEGPKNVALSAEIADGWMPIYFAPSQDSFYRTALAEGFARPGARHTLDTFEVACPVPVVPLDDVDAAVDFMRPMLALYIDELSLRGVRAYGLWRRSQQDPRRVPRRPKGRSSVVRDTADDRGDLLGRAGRQDPRRTREVARDRGQHLSHRRTARNPPARCRDVARITPTPTANAIRSRGPGR